MQSVPVLEYTLIAAADYSAKRYYGVYVSGEHTVTLCGAAPDGLLGVLQDKPAAAGAQCRVRILGSSEVSAGAAFSVGAKLTTDSNGQFVAATSGQKYFAIALSAATAQNDLVEAVLVRGTAA